MFEAGADSVFDDVHEERVRTERRGDEIGDTGVAFGRFGGERRDIAVPVIAGPKEIRCDHDRRAPAATHASNAVPIDGAASSMCAASTIG